MSQQKEINALKEEIRKLNNIIIIQKIRIDRIVQVLLYNLPRENLDKKINFSGQDCHGNFLEWSEWLHGYTLEDFLRTVIDP